MKYDSDVTAITYSFAFFVFAGDLISSYLLLKTSNYYEGNPFMAFIISNLGITQFIIINLILSLLLLCTLYYLAERKYDPPLSLIPVFVFIVPGRCDR